MNKTRMKEVTDKKTGLKKIDPETGHVEKREVPNHRALYDFTFSEPKSVSVFLALNDDQVLESMIAEALNETNSLRRASSASRGPKRARSLGTRGRGAPPTLSQGRAPPARRHYCGFECS